MLREIHGIYLGSLPHLHRRGGGRGARRQRRRLGLFCSRHRCLSRRLCARQIFFQLLDRLRDFREHAAARKLYRTQLGLNVFLIVRQLRREIDQLPGKHPARRPSRGENRRHDEKHRGDPTEPALDSRHQWRQEKGEQCRKRERNEEIARKIERGDDEGRQRDGPEADNRVSWLQFCFWAFAFRERWLTLLLSKKASSLVLQRRPAQDSPLKAKAPVSPCKLI